MIADPGLSQGSKKGSILVAFTRPLAPEKFCDPRLTAKGEPRAEAPFHGFQTLWFNTGTLCNITCVACYIDSSPRNDQLVYLTQEDCTPFLDELETNIEIGFTGGEPFMNPHIIALIDLALKSGHRALVLTNAMRPLMRPRVQAGVRDLVDRYGERLTLRVSLDHWSATLHDQERGAGSFEKTATGLDWLSTNGIRLALAGRLRWGETEAEARGAYEGLCASRGWPIVCSDPSSLVLFPEMDSQKDVPEISTACWDVLGKSPADLMCASSRMVAKRKGAIRPEVLACTLLPYDKAFSLGHTLVDSTAAPVPLNHPHCATFCVLGGASCS